MVDISYSIDFTFKIVIILCFCREIMSGSGPGAGCISEIELENLSKVNKYVLEAGQCVTLLKDTYILHRYVFVSMYLHSLECATTGNVNCYMNVILQWNGATSSANIYNTGSLLKANSLKFYYWKHNSSIYADKQFKIIYNVPEKTEIKFSIIFSPVYSDYCYSKKENTVRCTSEANIGIDYCLDANFLCDGFINCPYSDTDESACGFRHILLPKVIVVCAIILLVMFLMCQILLCFCHTTDTGAILSHKLEILLLNWCPCIAENNRIPPNASNRSLTRLNSDNIPLPPPSYVNNSPDGPLNGRQLPPTFSDIYDIGAQPSFLQRMFNLKTRKYTSRLESKDDESNHLNITKPVIKKSNQLNDNIKSQECEQYFLEDKLMDRNENIN